jgi:uncharacterized cofD-like protein
MQQKKIVAIGGGAGTDMLLAGLKRYTSRLTALISTFDASSHHHEGGDKPGPLADELRSSLLALGADQPTTRLMERLFNHHLASPPGPESSSFGNLFLSALTGITGTPDLALQAAAQVLNIRGQVLPVTIHECSLVAELDDGSEATVSTPAGLIAAASEAGLRRVRLAESAPLLRAAEEATLQADIVVFGPADFHFNVAAPLLVDGMAGALAASRAVKVFVCNILTQPNTTGSWSASHFIRELLSYLGENVSIDYVIVNSAPLSPAALARSAAKGAFPVTLDLEACLSLGMDVIVRPVASPDRLLHDPQKLARTILFLAAGPPARRTTRPQPHTSAQVLS